MARKPRRAAKLLVLAVLYGSAFAVPRVARRAEGKATSESLPQQLGKAIGGAVAGAAQSAGRSAANALQSKVEETQQSIKAEVAREFIGSWTRAIRLIKCMKKL